MPKGTESTIFGNITGTSYAWGERDGVFGRWPTSLLKGQDGAAGTNGTNGAAGYVITDNTSATSDLLLNAGDVAYLDFTATAGSTLPLHIQTVANGLYELNILGTYSTDASAGGPVSLRPNNAASAVTYLLRLFYIGASSNFVSNSTTTATPAFGMTMYDGIAHSYNAKISTKTTSKTVHASFITTQLGVDIYAYNTFQTWKDTTTAWTSLGTMYFTYAQSGKIVIRRII